ncbi:MAG TPA: DUF4124 domain-containing protein [Burkholderiales bacterium]|nr:DUF4124 domain-containing protein [Burkholderiales bacterium]
MTHGIAFLLLLGSLSLAAHGADIFRWVDEDEKIHYGDTIPDRYKAKKLDPKNPEVTEAQRGEAAARLAKEKARVDALEKAREAKSDAAQSGSSRSPDVPPAGDNANECQEQLKKYLDSQTCFAPYMIRGGGIKPEAFQNCTEVKQPKGCWTSSGPSDRTYDIPAVPGPSDRNYDIPTLPR